MSKRLVIYVQIFLIVLSPLFVLGNVQNAKAAPPTLPDEMQDHCLDTGAGLAETEDTKYAVSGTLGIEQLRIDFAKAKARPSASTDDVKAADDMIAALAKITDDNSLTVRLYKMGAYAGEGAGEIYCEDKTNGKGEFRFDGVYPGQYQLVVYDAHQDFSEAVKGALCSAAAGGGASIFTFILTRGSLIKSVIAGFIGAAAGEYLCKGEAMLFTAYAFVDKEAEDPKADDFTNDKEFKFSSYIPLTLTSKTTMNGILAAMTFIANSMIAGIINLFADKINSDLIIIDNLTKVPDVVAAWANVRDAANVLLLIALLIIAFANAARFQIEAYAAKALVPRLIIAAIFINFSLFLTQLIVDFANMLTVFLSGDGIHFYNILPISRDGHIVMMNSGSAVTTIGGGLLAFFFGAFILLITFIACVTVFLLLIVRIALIWVCAIFSPLIFLFGVLPFTRGLTGMWWKYLIQYAFMGPVMALILFVASRL